MYLQQENAPSPMKDLSGHGNGTMISANANASPTWHPAPASVFRELSDPREVLALMRLRHRVYFEHRAYGPPKAHGIDLTSHDHRAQLYGVFSGNDLIGGVRMVHRTEQPLAPVIRAMRAALQDDTLESQSRVLPSEEAFDLEDAVGVQSSLVDVELGRFVLLPGISPAVSAHVLIAVLAVLVVRQHRLYLYSCAARIAPRYARYMRPDWTLTRLRQNSVGVAGFAFPVETVAAVGAAKNSPYFSTVQRAADELSRTGRLIFPRAVPAPDERALRRTYRHCSMPLQAQPE
jgi:hypothetical protein